LLSLKSARDEDLDAAASESVRTTCDRLRKLIDQAQANSKRQRLLPIRRPATTIVPLPFTETGDDTETATGEEHRGLPAIGRSRTTLTPPITYVPQNRRRRYTVIAVAGVAVVVATAATVFLLTGWPKGGTAAPRATSSAPELPTHAKTDADCREGTSDTDIVDFSTTFTDDNATRITPTLDFDSMNGSARYQSHNGRIYYWGRAGSDDNDPHAGGSRVRWKTADGPWHSCSAILAVTERGYVHTPAVATTIAEKAVSIQICLWRDIPYRENCTATL
jgi:hypothetical protein